MDTSALNPRNSHHVRSNSLPSKPHPLINQVDEQLCRLRDSQATSSSFSLCHKLSGLRDLHDCIHKLLLFPLAQQALVQGRDKEVLDDLLEVSLRLLDLYGVAKNALLQTKECIYELESVLRRRRGEIGIASSLQKCLRSRKMIKKAIHKALKGVESKQSKKAHESLTLVNLIKEVEAVTYHSIGSLLSFIAGPKLQSKLSYRSLVSKLVQPKRVACIEEETNENEVEKLDSALNSIANYRSEKSEFLIQVEVVQNSLRECGTSIKDVEEELEGLYRFIIKTRVSLLNIFNH